MMQDNLSRRKITAILGVCILALGGVTLWGYNRMTHSTPKEFCGVFPRDEVIAIVGVHPRESIPYDSDASFILCEVRGDDPDENTQAGHLLWESSPSLTDWPAVIQKYEENPQLRPPGALIIPEDPVAGYSNVDVYTMYQSKTLPCLYWVEPDITVRACAKMNTPTEEDTAAIAQRLYDLVVTYAPIALDTPQQDIPSTPNPTPQ